MGSPPSSSAPQAAPAAPATSSEQHPVDLCRYAGKRCFNPRATKRNGECHSLCHMHRVRANQNQRRMELKRRLSRNREDSARAVAYSHAYSRAAAMYSAFQIAASTGSISTVYPSSSASSLPSPFPAAGISASVLLSSMSGIDAHLDWDAPLMINGGRQKQHHYQHQQQEQEASWHSVHRHHYHHQTSTAHFSPLNFATPADYTLEAFVEPVMLDDGSYSFADLSCSIEMAKDDELARTVLVLADSQNPPHETLFDPQHQEQPHGQNDMWTVPNFLLTL